jgi:hypothetical protein
MQLTSMRNVVTHESRLAEFRGVSQDTIRAVGQTNIMKPRLPSRQDAVQYCEETWEKLVKYNRDVATEILR